MAQEELIEKFKNHIGWEEGMDDSMLSSYLSYAKKYVKNATGNEGDHLVLMVAAIFYDFRVPEKDMDAAVDALTPFIIQEVFSENEETDE